MFANSNITPAEVNGRWLKIGTLLTECFVYCSLLIEKIYYLMTLVVLQKLQKEPK